MAIPFTLPPKSSPFILGSLITAITVLWYTTKRLRPVEPLFPNHVKVVTPTPLEKDYVYDKLDSEAEEIRLIAIDGASKDQDAIHCKISRVRLESAGGYIALSYVWGNPNYTTWIWVDGFRLKVTLNLYAALKQIRAAQAQERNPDAPKKIWVDAICINQNNQAEKASQIPLMGKIYSGAKYVVGWLGASTRSTESALQFILDLAEFFKTSRNDERKVADASSWVLRHTSRSLIDCQWMAVAELFNREWFSRAWIVQEVILSKDVVLLCGPFYLHLNKLWHAAAVYKCFSDKIHRLAAEVPLNHVDPGSHSFLGSRRYWILSHGAQHQLKMMATRVNRERPSSFYDIVLLFYNYRITNPRDKLYAFRSLCSPDHLEILHLPINYTMSVAELYAAFCRRHLETRHDLGFLSQCFSWQTLPGLPSWVPSSIMNYIYEPLASLNHQKNFSACGDTLPQASFGPMYQQLFLRGSLVDSVAVVGETMGLRKFQFGAVEGERAPCIRKWAKLVDPEVDQSNRPQDSFCLRDFPCYVTAPPFYAPSSVLSGNYLTGISTSEAFTRLILANQNGDIDFDTVDNDDTYPDCSPLLKNSPLSRARKRLIILDLRAAESVCGGRRFFITSSGYFGVGDPGTAIGDKVCVFFGAKVPFVVRPRRKESDDNNDNDDNGKGDYYTLIGECYVQGLMSGEAVERMKGNDGKSEADNIKLR